MNYLFCVKAELNVVISDYDAAKPDELSINKNKDFVEVLRKCQSGFWRVRMFDGREGLVPAVCLKKVTCPTTDKMTLLNSFKVKGADSLDETAFNANELTLKDDITNSKSDDILNSSTDSFNQPTPVEDNKLIFG